MGCKGTDKTKGAVEMSELMDTKDKTAREIAQELKSIGMRCNCDLDNWEPEHSTGHSKVCRFHKTAMERKNY